MLFLDWKLALIIIAFGFAPVIPNALFARPLRLIGSEIHARLGIVGERMSDLLAGFEVIRAINFGDWMLGRFNLANSDLLNSGLKRVRIAFALAAADTFANLFSLFSICIDAYLVMINYTAFGIFLVLVQLQQYLIDFADIVGNFISEIQVALAATDRITAILKNP